MAFSAHVGTSPVWVHVPKVHKLDYDIQWCIYRLNPNPNPFIELVIDIANVFVVGLDIHIAGLKKTLSGECHTVGDVLFIPK